ncbi:MAG: restriction endonuclease subunit R [Candidatus Zambryskibacteria bacterium RIFOXYC1_FULL_39_10]|uniref:Restriction endonuclease subunit R n=1 Tax=Candidatus Zambryskibacteria bacterium RIFOXYC1_FULL_39_10 TaxID=1802779 RepID=A0A1G2UZG2_9BACT|nr:MAG: restriction endonuclease subunit R [Candidatus Zambryskibacteria bacterium RIFOXYC1_FULL_39_10]OHB16002.1 MAG: restriction endonuclease subunit R [Candidatus Zambryskibacteria bacterium RIFOXYD1_FULL_39_35]
MEKEAGARIKINKLLEEAKWRFFDNEKGSANIVLEENVKLTPKAVNELGEDFDKVKEGFVDFLLLDQQSFPYVVLEAKSEGKNPLDGKEQARKYAQSLSVRFVILSNGNLHYFWDLERGSPNVITSFPTQESLSHFEQFKPDTRRLSDEKVKEDYIVLTQNADYEEDPRWDNDGERKSFVLEQDFKFLRPYQLKAIHALQNSAKNGFDRYLFEMATGTGKTLTCAAVIKLFLKTGNAKRVLFLVDRLELEDQAAKNFKKWLSKDYTTVIYKENKGDWRKAEIVVSTVQSLSANNKYQKLFTPTDFDLIISDEAHRSIGGNSRAVFEYFVGYKLGLTATPKNYLKGIDPNKLNEKDPRAWERRQLLDTYKTFGCEVGEPTFRYSLLDGVKEGYLINPVVADARTEITTELLSEKGYSLLIDAEEGKEEQTFYHTDFERKFFSDKTNLIFSETFLKNALMDPISGELGKSIVYCVSQNHASKITQILNQFADKYWPGKYNSDFAVQVTSNISDAQTFTINFSNNNLNGHTKWLEGYLSSKSRICVTVGMMTTGYDCQDILNLCLMRPIFSPTDFIQIKGRGTRKYNFSYQTKENGEVETRNNDKNNFKLFDFFANCEYFEEKFNYDEILTLPPRTGPGPGPGPGPVPIDETTIFTPDPLKTFQEKAIGPEGMKVDRKLFEKFEEVIKSDEFVKEKYEAGDMQAVEDYVKTEIFDKPEEYFSLDKIRKALKIDRRLTLSEVLDKVFGRLDKFKNKDELLEEEFEKFISIYKPESKYYYPIKNYLKAYITDTEIREIVESKEYARFATNPKVTMADFSSLNGYRDVVPEYVKDYVSLNIFM